MRCVFMLAIMTAAAALLQIMPWPTYGNVSDDDVRAIYEYLKAIHLISRAGTMGFPANLYQPASETAQTMLQPPSYSSERNRGER